MLSIPVIEISSSKDEIASLQQTVSERVPQLVPIHPLSGPQTDGNVMIDCTDTDSAAITRDISTRLAQILGMESVECPLDDHDAKVLREQAQMHVSIWDEIAQCDDLLWKVQILATSNRK